MSSSLAPDKADGPLEIEVLFPEAKQRARRRHLWVIGSILLAIVLAGTIGLIAIASNGGRGSSTSIESGHSGSSPSAGAHAATSNSPSKASPNVPAISPAGTTTAPVQTPVTVPLGSPCSIAAIETAVQVANATGTVEGFDCSGGFAYAFVTIPLPTGASGGTSAITQTDFFVENGSTWILADRRNYCPVGTVPPAIYHGACETN